MIHDLVPALASVLERLLRPGPRRGSSDSSVYRVLHSFDFGFSRSIASRLDELARDETAIANRAQTEYPLSSALYWIAGTGYLLIVAAAALLATMAGPSSPGQVGLSVVCFLLGGFLLLLKVRVTQVARQQRSRFTCALQRHRRCRLNRQVVDSIRTSISLYGPGGPTNKDFALLLIRGMPPRPLGATP